MPPLSIAHRPGTKTLKPGSCDLVVYRIRIYYEGNDDRALLEAWQGGGLLPEVLEIAARVDKSAYAHGRDGMLHEIAALVSPSQVGGRAVALADLDDAGPEALLDWLRSGLQKLVGVASIELASASPISVLSLSAGARTGYVALVPAGLPVDEDLRSRFRLESFAMDDHILRLACYEQVYAAVSEFRPVTYALAMRKLDEMKGLFETNRIPLKRAKRFLHLLCATTGVRTSQATIITKVVQSALKVKDTEEVRRMLSPLLDDILEASQWLSSAP